MPTASWSAKISPTFTNAKKPDFVRRRTGPTGSGCLAWVAETHEHDIITGSTAEGRLVPGKTCNDWTSESPDMQAQVGHVDGIGLGGNTAGASGSWNSAHESRSCADTAPGGVLADSTASRRSKKWCPDGDLS